MIDAAEFMRRIADAAAAETLPRFRSAGDVLATSRRAASIRSPRRDREAEKAIRALIQAEYPDHGILGEEFGSENAASEPYLGDRSDRRHALLHFRRAAVGHAGRADRTTATRSPA